MKQIMRADPAVVAADTFAPEAPTSWNHDPHEWLTSDDIEIVMRQYEDKFPAFEFLGPSPIDYNAPKRRKSSCAATESPTATCWNFAKSISIAEAAFKALSLSIHFFFILFRNAFKRNVDNMN